ncbi:wax ester/triacylglycerol synthase family O-acyltransferase [Mycolicibacterium pulveris]|uniref:Diacylglycerol O-acyltransferase n=1 Tax=Mycolicibacterium pulveris TaxID=36813 RepID=A0A7I7UEY5_MYCPV|nr:wax ester/triacylglycerol synthase family O-acyltransferase [Mycolicibacterium pulveris]MCV6979150.1 wax ester/triacylglycerol synthase family O-acyltransferase [Mycolicibacterium pulveris]BBY79640.1 diacylglycerol O-acyltransferase [Mycolicibacterium pulveris]
MVTRLSASDAAFYQLENSSTPMYVGSLAILRKPRSGLSYETLLATVEQRLPQIPRYRQKVREVTLGLARPVWVDDRDFDITYHIRRSALPSPGSDAQLHELIARLGSRPLDKSRPLWEMYLIEGLAKNRIALYTKSHQALVNGMTALEIGHVIADRTQKPPQFGEDIWIPAREPSDRQLLLGAVGEWITRPAEQLGAVRSAVAEAATNAGQWVEVGRRFIDVARTVARGNAPSSPLNTTVSRNRRITVASGKLEDYRMVRARYDCDVNDVVLAVIAGALRNWLMSRGEPVTASTTVRAMAPMSVYPDAELDTGGPGQAISEVSPFLVDLPVGEGNAVIRLSQIAHATESHPTAASLVDARTIVTLSGFAPPTLHAMGIRVATSFSARQFNLLITNVPGAQSQMYIAGAKLLETYAVPPLLHNQVLAIGVTSYNGMVYYGINADRDAMSDVGVLPSLISEALDELREAAQ